MCASQRRKDLLQDASSRQAGSGTDQKELCAFFPPNSFLRPAIAKDNRAAMYFLMVLKIEVQTRASGVYSAVFLCLKGNYSASEEPREGKFRRQLWEFKPNPGNLFQLGNGSEALLVGIFTMGKVASQDQGRQNTAWRQEMG